MDYVILLMDKTGEPRSKEQMAAMIEAIHKAVAEFDYVPSAHGRVDGMTEMLIKMREIAKEGD